MCVFEVDGSRHAHEVWLSSSSGAVMRLTAAGSGPLPSGHGEEPSEEA